jgi:hypothetical protein
VRTAPPVAKYTAVPPPVVVKEHGLVAPTEHAGVDGFPGGGGGATTAAATEEQSAKTKPSAAHTFPKFCIPMNCSSLYPNAAHRTYFSTIANSPSTPARGTRRP